MIYFLLFIFQIVLLIILIVITTLFVLWVIGNIKNRVPFVTSPKKVLERISKEFDIKDNDILYDLGSGDGRVLFYLAQKNPKAKYIGIENNPFPVLLSRVDNFLRRKKIGKSVEIRDESFFNTDISNATHIFTYLYPNIMDELLSKFEKELKPGTKLISLSFKFASKQPISEVDLGRNKYKLGRKLYIYQF